MHAQKTKSRAVSIILILTLVFTFPGFLAAQPVEASETPAIVNLEDTRITGDLTINRNGTDVETIEASVGATIIASGPAINGIKLTGTLDPKYRVILDGSNGTDLNVLLENATVSHYNYYGPSSISLTKEANVNLTLIGTNTVNRYAYNNSNSNVYGACIEVASPQAISIVGDGTLNATNSGRGAGIGGGYNGSTYGGNITITDSVKVTAIVGNGAGIGGGYNGESANGSNITIEGNAIVTASSIGGSGIGGNLGKNITIKDNATVNATGYSAGIGGISGEDIYITGEAVVTASSDYGAGIGGGYNGIIAGGNAKGIYIGGKAQVQAYTKYTDGLPSVNYSGSGAGIGGGRNGNAEDIYITGEAMVTASSANGGAGIGGGNKAGGTNGIGDNINIGGDSTVTATAIDGAGIGGGSGSTGSNININGNANVAAFSSGGAGIGGGRESNGENIYIHGISKVIAFAGDAAGIGGGYYGGHGKNINIFENATVKATSGDETITPASNGNSAGIGGGFRGNGENISIYGNATVKATSMNLGAGIGGGRGGDGKNIIIYGNANVTASNKGTGSGKLNGAGIGSGARDQELGGWENTKYGGNAENIIISDSAVVIAESRYAPGIGGTVTASGIKIFGGFVSASSGYCADIGSGDNDGLGTTENFIIDGGSVFAVNDRFTITPKNSAGSEVFKVTVPATKGSVDLRTNLDITTVENSVDYTGKTISSDKNEHGSVFPTTASAFIYLPAGTYSNITLGDFTGISVDVSSDGNNAISWEDEGGKGDGDGDNDVIVTVSAVKIDVASKNLNKGKTLQLRAQILPVNATDKTLIWSSNNSKIATVSNAGKVTAMNVEGQVTITAKSSSGKVGTCKINVVQPVTKIRTPLKQYYLSVKKSIKVPVVLDNGNNLVVSKLTVKSSNTKVATATVNGSTVTIKAKNKKGSAKITVTTYSGKTQIIKVNVSKKSAKLKGIKVKGLKKKYTKGKTAQISISTSPKKATNLNVVYKSNKKKVATVDKAGKITFKNKGKVTITVKVGSKTVKKKITVK